MELSLSILQPLVTLILWGKRDTVKTLRGIWTIFPSPQKPEREIWIQVCFWQDEQVQRLFFGGKGERAKDLHVCQAGKSV